MTSYKKSILCILMMGVSIVSAAQVDHTFINMQIASGGLPPYQSIRELNAELEDTKGNIYLYNEWKECLVKLKGNDNQIRLVSNFNLKNRTLEIQYKSMVYVVEWDRVDLVKVQGEQAFEIRYVDGYGICEVLEPGEVSLLKLHDVSLREANYSPSHDVGNKFDEWVRESEFLIEYNDQIHAAGKRKLLIRSFGNLPSISDSAFKELSNRPSENELREFIKHLQ